MPALQARWQGLNNLFNNESTDGWPLVRLVDLTAKLNDLVSHMAMIYDT